MTNESEIEFSLPPSTIPLTHAHRFAHEVGQKALALSFLAGRFTVPGGFVIPCKTLDRLFLGKDADAVMLAGVLEAYRALVAIDPGPVAVRSSGVDEDGHSTSFAGQYETILGIAGEADLVPAIRRCWESGRGERAARYIKSRGVAEKPGALAVLVQHMISADAAGVAFSINPVTGSPAEVIISAAWGLGEAVVDGLVIPDSFYVSRATRQIRRELGDKDIQVIYRDGRTVEEPVAAEQRQQFSLEDAVVLTVADWALALERERGHAVDIEFAVTGDTVYLLQVRPVTGA